MAKNQVRNLSEAQTLFRKELESMGRSGVHLRDVFDDFLFMAFTAFRQAVHVFKKGEQDDELERSLWVLKKRYEVPNEFGRALGALVMGLEHTAHDFLGEFYGAIEAHNTKSGQFFTPSSLSNMTARMMLNREHYEATIAKGERFAICEPCVGAGSMVIEIVKIMEEWGADPSTWYVDATDVDIRCVRMAYIQFTLLGIPAWVRHCNTLSLEQWGQYDTIRMAMNPFIPRQQVPSDQTGRAPLPQPGKTLATPQATAQGISSPGQKRTLRLVRNA